MTTATSGVIDGFPLLLPVRNSDLGCTNYGAEALPAQATPLWRAAVRTSTEGTAKPRAQLQSRTPCQACAALAFFCRPGSGARSVGRRTVPSSNQTPSPKSTRMPRSGLPRVFVRSLACTSMQTFGGRCSCTRAASTARMRNQWRRQEQSRVRDAHAICERRSDHDLGQLRSHHVSAHDAVPTTLTPAAW